MDLSDLLGTNLSGLLSPQQQGASNSDILQSAGAALLRASGPSPYKAKMTTLAGLGDAIAAGVGARRASGDDALKQRLVASQISKNQNDQLIPALNLAAQYQANGIPLPPQLQALLQRVGGGLAPPVGGGVPGAMAQANQATGGALSGAPQGASAPSIGGQSPAQIQAGAGAPAIGGQTPAQIQGGDVVMQTARELGINPHRVMMKDPTAMKAIEERIHAQDPTLEDSERRKGIMKSDIDRSEKLYPAFVTLGQNGQKLKEDSDLSAALAKDPGFKSGFGAGMSELAKKFMVSIGGDPNGAFSMEAFRKITASNVNSQINDMKASAAEMGGAAGRIFQSQAGLMEKASQNLDNTPAANAFLANLQHRAAQQNIDIGDKAIQYKKNHGILDAGFDEEVSAYLKKYPLFTRDELANLRTQTGHTSPASAVPGQAPAAVAPAAPTGAVHRAVGPNGAVIYLDATGKVIPPQQAPAPAGPAMAAGPAPIPQAGQ